MQSDCGVHSSLSGWGAGLFSSNHPSRKLSSLPCTGPLRGCPPPRERGLQQKTEQPGGLRADILMGSLSPPTPAWRMLNSASTYPPPPPRLHLSTSPPSTLPGTILPSSSPNDQQLGAGWDLAYAPPLQIHSPPPTRSILGPLISSGLSLSIHILTQVFQTLRLDGATREEGKFPSGNQRTGLPGTQGQ